MKTALALFAYALSLAFVIASQCSAAETDAQRITRYWKAVEAAVPKAAEDPTRPVCHFRPPAQWMNDICGAIYDKGYYHIFYQLNPFGDTWGANDSSWAHARSKDLVRWEHLPIALAPRTDRGERRCNSGCVARNADGTPMIFYTFVPARTSATKLGKREQWAAVACDDELKTWQRVKENPLLAAGENGVPADINGGWSDPFVFRAGGRTFATFKSCGGGVCEAENKELTKWKYIGRIDGVEGECPNFFKLGGRWVLLRSTYPPSYQIGRFDPEKMRFEMNGPRGTLDYVYGPKRSGPNSRGFYGTNVLFDADGRCVLFGWVSGFKPGRGWNGCMSIPRILTLGSDERPIQTPAPELEKLRGEHVNVENLTLKNESKVIQRAGDTFEVRAEFTPGDAKSFGLKLGPSNGRAGGFTIACNGKNLNAAGTEVPDVLTDKQKTLKLRLFFDKSVMELFIGDGRQTVTRVVYPESGNLRVEAFAAGGTATIKRLDAWALKPIW